MRQRGFTLLEMVIGMTLLGFILMLMYSGLRLGSRSWDAGERMTEQVSRQVAVAQFLHRQLSQIYPLRWKVDEKEVLAFVGESDRMQFAGPIAAHFGPAGIQLLALESTRDGEAGTFLLRWQFPTPEDKRFEFHDGSSKVNLVSDLTKLELSYFGAENLEEEPVWRDAWHSETYLPMLIRVRLADQRDGAWPDVVVAPRLVADAGCVWDDFYKKCRN